MKDMELTEGAIYPEMSIAQHNVGKLEIESMAFSSSCADHIRFCYEITLRDSSQDKVGWGKVIFQGTLKELIDLVKTKVEVK